MIPRAAGILFVSPGGNGLFLRRTSAAPDCPNCWDFPGGGAEEGETAEQTARREALEEVGELPDGDLTLHTRTAPSGGVGHGAPSPVLPVPVDGAPAALDAPAMDAVAVDFTTFLMRVPEEFAPTLNEEHDGWAWSPLTTPPEPLHPGCRIALARLAMNELEVARAIADGRLISPQRYENVWLFALRITGTSVAFRPKAEEFVMRKPELYLTPEFLARCNGLPVIWKHPKKSLLDSKEFSDRVVGTVFLPYIAGDEVWAVAKIFVDEAAQMMKEGGLSTSPGVNFADFSVNMKLRLEDDSKVLVEGKPSLLDHVAVCELGVWDKGTEPTGIRSESREDSAMADKEEDKREDAVKNDASKKDEFPDDLKKKADASKKDDDGDKNKKEEEKSKDDAAKADADAGTSLDKTLGHIADSLSGLHKRMDAFEEKSKDDAARKDAAKKDDKEEEEKGEAKRAAADKSKKDAAKKDADDKEEKAKTDSADLRADLRRIESLIPKGYAETDYAAVADAQARADAVFADFGQRAPIPLAHESVQAYERRMVRALRQHSPTWKGVDPQSQAFADDASFGIIRDQVYAEAKVAALSPVNLPDGTLRMKAKSSGGHTINEFIGEPRAWMDSMAGPSRQYVTQINTPRN